MNAKQFFDKVAVMRKAQKDYFHTRSQASLRQSKALEREIDAEIERVRSITGDTRKEPEQRNLFGGGNAYMSGS